MKRCLNTFFLCFGILSNAYAYSVSTPTQLQGTLSMPLARNAIINPQHQLKQACLQAQDPTQYHDCMISTLKNNHINSQALQIYDITNGYLNKYQKNGPVTVMKTDVRAADHSEEFFVANSLGQIYALRPGEAQRLLEQKSIPEFDKLRFCHPDLLFARILNDIPSPVKLKNNNSQVVMDIELRNKCMACEVLGTIRIAYLFNSQGKYQDVKFISLRRHDHTMLANTQCESQTSE